MNLKTVGIAVLFVLGVAYFCVRGPYRAVVSLNSYDFATVYGATKAWMHGENPYDMPSVLKEMTDAGHPPTEKNTEPPPSIYLPATPPLMTALVGWLRWPAAKVFWCLLSIAVFGASLIFVLGHSALPPQARWLLAGLVLFFSPTTSGLSTGNPSVITCALCLLALHFGVTGRLWTAGIILGLANSLKPQDSIIVCAVFLLFRYWKALIVSFIIPVVGILISLWRAGSVATFINWIHTCQAAVAGTFIAGGLSDPRPSNPFSYHIITLPSIFGLFISNLRTEDVLSWIVAGTVAAIYLLMRGRIASSERFWRDLAFFSAVVLTIVYHRYYDAEILLAALPFLIRYRNVHSRIVAFYAGCLAVLWFPLQPMFAERFHGIDPRSVPGFLMLRHEPVLVLAMALAMIPWMASDNAGGSAANLSQAEALAK